MTFLTTTSGARRWRAFFFRRGTFLSLLLLAVAAGAQAGVRAITATTPDATRAELTRLLDSLQRVDSTSGGKPQQRRDRRDEIAAVRTRLTDGDFQVADRFLIDFGNPGQRPDTVTVRDSSNISLLNWPSYSLHGVLRSELQAAMEKYVGTYLREPRLRVYTLTRISIIGGVGRPGVYPVDPSHTLSDAIMSAGGTGQFGKSEKITVYRGNERILTDKQVASAVRDGATIEDLGMQSGDQVRVPVQRSGSSRVRVQTILLTVSVLTALVAFIRASYVP